MDDTAIGNHVNGMFMGMEIGKNQHEAIGRMEVAEYAWHTIESAIESLEKDQTFKALMLLRTLKFALAVATGYEMPKFTIGHD